MRVISHVQKILNLQRIFCGISSANVAPMEHNNSYKAATAAPVGLLPIDFSSITDF
jgi:hypothetical protein